MNSLLFSQVVYSAEEALAWCLQIAEGLAYLHARRPAIVHRDLKLENCLLTGATSACVMTCDLSTRADPHLSIFEVLSQLGMTGHVVRSRNMSRLRTEPGAQHNRPY